MQLTELRVRNFRNIGAEQTLRLNRGTTLVGPNNSGKTNLLKSVQLFFTGYDNTGGYTRGSDFTIGAGSQQTSLVATFSLDGHARDQEVIELLDDLHEILGTERDPAQFTVNLYFTGVNDTPVYRVFPNAKIPTTDRPTFSRKQKQLVEILLRTFRCHYVPSAKSISGLYQDLLEPFLREAAYRAIEPHLAGVYSSLDEISGSLNYELEAVGLSNFKAKFLLEADAPGGLLPGFKLMLSDPGETPIFEKGQGIQSTALFASFVWITEREKADGIVPVWLIEEPESYLHPELIKSCHELLDNLSEKSLVVLTTHALAFVPTQVDRAQGVDLDPGTGHTAISAFTSHQQATRRIRDSLGVQFADYYNLGLTNIFVEGPSDARLIAWASSLLSEKSQKKLFPRIDSSLIENFGGVKQLEGFLRGVFEPLRLERAVVSVFDGDEAGVKSRRDLQQYFTQKNVTFQPNREFVSVRAGFAIEGLFPDEWIVSLYTERRGWFQHYSIDAGGQLEPYRIKDPNKKDVIDYLVDLAETQDDLKWAKRWFDLLSAVELSLDRQLRELGLAKPGE